MSEIGHAIKICPYCAAQQDETAVICAYCGMKIGEMPEKTKAPADSDASGPISRGEYHGTVTEVQGPTLPPANSKDKYVSLLLCFFGGFFGLHKFYEGKIGMGILYLLTGGLFGFGAIIDFFVLLCKPQRYYR